MDTLRVACFVSPHGFGHAARASAVMEALHRLGGVGFELFASSPRWFFDESIPGLYDYRETRTDVGLRQRSALHFDLPATVAELQAMLPFDDPWLDSLAGAVHDAGCRAVLCDIAPLGVAVAERAGVPSLLVENFTWPWLYEPLLPSAPELRPLSDEIRRWLDRVTWRVQTQPLCRAVASAGLRVPPIGRRARRTRADVRRSLGVAGDARLVLLTMGGVPEELPFLERLETVRHVDFLVIGAPVTGARGNLRLFAQDARLYLPDLVRASDAVVAKMGYSTVAEVWQEGRPLAWVTRSDSRETEPVRRWVARELAGFEIPAWAFAEGRWVERIPELLAMGGSEGHREGGADVVARFLLEKLGA